MLMSPSLRAASCPVRSIGVLHPTFEFWGGAEWFIHSTANALVREDGVQVTVYTHRWNKPPSEPVAYQAVEHRSGGILSGPWDWDRIARCFADRWAVHDVLFLHNHPAAEWVARARRLEPMPPTVWYCHEPPRHLYEAARDDASLVPNMRWQIGRLMFGVAFYRETTVRRIYSRWRLRRTVARLGRKGWQRTLRSLDSQAIAEVGTIVANSRYTAGRIREVYHRCSQVVYPLLPHLDATVPFRAVQHKAPLVLWVGRLTAEKRPLEMLEAWSEAMASGELSNLTLVMVGDGPLWRQLQARLEKFGLHAHVKCLRGLSRPELAARYRQALLTVHLAEAEPFGLVPLESMWEGTPVLAVCDGGVQETVSPGQTGFSVADTDPSRLARQLVDILREKDRLEQMGRVAAETVRARFSFGKTLNDLRAIMCDAVS